MRMEWVFVSLIVLLMVIIWAFVKLAQLSVSWKAITELNNTREVVEKSLADKMDLDLQTFIEQWKTFE